MRDWHCAVGARQKRDANAVKPLCACNYEGGYDAALLTHICTLYDLPPLVGRALIRRGVTDDGAINAFLHPSFRDLCDPFALPDMEAAVSRIRRAVACGERICVYGDYDADGVCATAILIDCLRRLGADAFYRIPSRHGEGYGLHAEALREIARDGARLVITVDNGISALDEAQTCRLLGMELIVTDHHLPREVLPAACAVVAATRGDSAYPNAALCGAGVALQLSRALDPGGDHGNWLALAAVATVADVVPLLGENRAIVSLGLETISDHVGLSALLSCAGQGDRPLTGETLAFLLAPRLNAAGRMSDADRAVTLLLSQDAAQAAELAAWLDGQNRMRRTEEQRILNDIETRYPPDTLSDRRSIVLFGEDWHLGVIGIVASRLTERFHRPTLLFGKSGDLLTGSCRSIPNLDLHACLTAFSDRFERFGGHARAAGITMLPERFDAFAADLESYLLRHVPAETFEPVLPFEEDIDPAELTVEAVSALQRLAPFGEGNPEPVFRMINAELADVRRIGGQGTHASMTVRREASAFRAVGFGFGGRTAELAAPVRWTLLYAPQRNEFGGCARVELRLAEAFPVDAAKVFRAFLSKVLYNTDVDYDKLCEVFVASHGVSPFAALHLEADALRRRYVRLRRMIGDGVPMRTASELSDADDLFACCLFLDLGFLLADQQRGQIVPVPQPLQRQLTDSALYRRAVRAQI